MSESPAAVYGPLLIAALEHERVCYATVLQVETDQERNADARLTEGYAARVQEARARWMAATDLVRRLQQVLNLAE